MKHIIVIGAGPAGMMAAIKAHFPPEVKVFEPMGGMFVWCELPKGAMPTSITPDQNFPETNSLPIEEGGVKKILVNVYERDPRARKICLEKLGTSCRVCSMNFEKTYGERGKGFIHVHHLDPLGTRKKRKKIDPIKDLVPVCPNCHAMLHSTDPPLGIEELKKEFVKMNVKP